MIKGNVWLADGFEEIEALTVVDLLRRAQIYVGTVSVGEEYQVHGSHGINVTTEDLFEEVDFSEAEGKICAEFIALYPPGIPLIVPGEVISREFLERITLCVRMGLQMESRSDLSGRRITIVYC